MDEDTEDYDEVLTCPACDGEALCIGKVPGGMGYECPDCGHVWAED